MKSMKGEHEDVELITIQVFCYACGILCGRSEGLQKASNSYSFFMQDGETVPTPQPEEERYHGITPSERWLYWGLGTFCCLAVSIILITVGVALGEKIATTQPSSRPKNVIFMISDGD